MVQVHFYMSDSEGCIRIDYLPECGFEKATPVELEIFTCPCHMTSALLLSSVAKLCLS